MEEVETDLCLKNRECLDLRKRRGTFLRKGDRASQGLAREGPGRMRKAGSVRLENILCEGTIGSLAREGAGPGVWRQPRAESHRTWPGQSSGWGGLPTGPRLEARGAGGGGGGRQNPQRPRPGTLDEWTRAGCRTPLLGVTPRLRPSLTGMGRSPGTCTAIDPAGRRAYEWPRVSCNAGASGGYVFIIRQKQLLPASAVNPEAGRLG